MKSTATLNGGAFGDPAKLKKNQVLTHVDENVKIDSAKKQKPNKATV